VIAPLLGAGVVGRWRAATWLAVTVGVTAGAYTASPRVVIEGVGDVRRVGRARAGLPLGPEWSF
jgi:hypothetical protein